MFDFDAGKLLIIGIVALVVIGPKELPRVMRQVGQVVAKLRRMASEFQGQFMDAMKEADLQDVRAEMSKLQSHVSSNMDLSTSFDPARDVQRELTQAVSTTSAAPAAVEASAAPAVAPEAAPIVVPGPAPVDPIEATAVSQRKVVPRKRRAPPPGPPASPYRNVRPRRQEADR